MALTSRRPSSAASNSSAPRHDDNDNDPDVKFPATQLFLLALVRAAEPIAILSILPYAWKFVLHFHVGDRDNASFYAGVLIASFSLAESLSGLFWGGLSDRLGRKPVLLMGCCGTIVSLLVVGFSSNFWMALIARFMGGILNGNQGVVQTMVGELVTRPEHEPKAYAIMPFVWSIGGIVGPSIGGYFAEPATNFPNVFPPGGVFDRFPYLLPNIICAGLMAVSVVAGYFCLEETHPDKKPSSSTQDPVGEIHYDSRTPLMLAQANSSTAPVDLEHESYGTFNEVTEDAADEEWNLKADGTTRTPSIISVDDQKVFTNRVIMLTVALGIFTYHSMTYDHLFPIFCQDDRVPLDGHSMEARPEHLFAGGLGLSTQQVGIILSINGMIALVVQAVVFPLMASWLGIWKTFIVTAVAHPLTYFVVPFLALLPDNRWMYAGIYACLTVRNLSSILAYPVLLILIKEASPSPSCFGRINGLAASTGAGARTVASPVAGFVYGVGAKADFTALAWWVSAGVALVGTIQAFFVARVKNGPSHRVRPAAACALIPDEHRHRPSVVHIRVQDQDFEYNPADESTPFASRVPRGSPD